MDIPFSSSGAMSRAHYGLVRKVETAPSPQAADQILLKEFDVMRRSLQQPRLSIKECRECLILLLYCAMALTTASPGDLSFAFPHALNLAELGRSLMDKKVGYLFCVELMSRNHELQLMLVNTLRKDLESPSISRVCLALDVLVQMPNDDAVPAVQSRLRSLVRHTSSAVRRRAYMAYYILNHHDAEQVSWLENVLEQSNSWTGAPIPLSMVPVAGKLKHSESLGRLLNSQLQSKHGNWNDILVVVRTLRRGKMKLIRENVSVVLNLIKHASGPHVQATLREAFLLLSTVVPEVLRESQAQLSFSPIASIRYLLTSKDPNDLYLFVSCLSLLDPSTWAGTLPETTVVLDEWEIQEVTKLLYSRDSLTRKMTLKALQSVDPGILETHYAQCGKTIPRDPLKARSEYVSQIIEIIDTQCVDDVDQYARHLKDLLATVDGEDQGRTGDLPVLEGVVERILCRVRDMETASRTSCATALAVSVIEPEIRVGPTLMVVISALVCEHCGMMSTSPVELLRGLARRLASYSPSVQDACLLSMLRISAECDDIPEDVTNAARALSQLAGRHIRRRCEQFLALYRKRSVLADVVSRAPTSSLPDFLFALTSYQSNYTGGSSYASTPVSTSQRAGASEFSPPAVTSAAKLRYEPYATPQTAPSLRHFASPRRPDSSLSSPGSTTTSLSRTNDTARHSDDLARTVTPGELTLAASLNPFENVQEARAGAEAMSIAGKTPERGERGSLDDLASRTDLIVLDSPFVAESMRGAVPAPLDFEEIWNSMEKSNARGWCEAPLDSVVRLLRSLKHRIIVIAADQPPFDGDLKVLVQGPGAEIYAALRLRAGDDESCLWRLRCSDLELRIVIKRLLEGI
ncbi:armadillo-type protein [Phlebopus sp. FC_14]|nr:armadillo-type protein [Phlebopus sp. FC_14]